MLDYKKEDKKEKKKDKKEDDMSPFEKFSEGFNKDPNEKDKPKEKKDPKEGKPSDESEDLKIARKGKFGRIWNMLK